MDFIKLPEDIIINIFEILFMDYNKDIFYNDNYLDDYYDDYDIITYDLYIAKCYGLFMCINKDYKKEFTKNYYWKHLLNYCNINKKNNNNLQYINCRILPYYKNNIYYFNNILNEHNIELKAYTNNYEDYLKIKESSKIFGLYTKYITKKQNWYIEYRYNYKKYKNDCILFHNKHNIVVLSDWENNICQSLINSKNTEINDTKFNIKYFENKYNIIINLLQNLYD